MNDYLRATTVRFANVYGIGQMLPVGSTCSNYLTCPGVPVSPTTRNDFINADNVKNYNPSDLHLTLAMTFTNLAHPERTLEIMKQYDELYPGLFQWMGEVNLVKQNQFNNLHIPAPKSAIRRWDGFMSELRKRSMPITIHSDIGNDTTPTKYLSLMEYALSLYPQNTIIWAHMGLSYEQLHLNARQHIAILTDLLERYPHLMLDISWRLLEDNYFSQLGNREQYVEFINRYSSRILPGSDFVGFKDNTYSVYRSELEATSRILAELDDKAFRNIALGANYFKLLKLNFFAPEICN
jgi:hypothetical protein